MTDLRDELEATHPAYPQGQVLGRYTLYQSEDAPTMTAKPDTHSDAHSESPNAMPMDTTPSPSAQQAGVMMATDGDKVGQNVDGVESDDGVGIEARQGTPAGEGLGTDLDDAEALVEKLEEEE